MKDRSPEARGWVRQSLDRTLITSQVGAVAAAQPALVAAALVSDLQAPVALVIALHAIVLIANVAAYRGRLSAVAGIGMSSAALVVDCAVAVTPQTPLALLALVVTPLTVPSLFIMFRGAVPVLSSLAVLAGSMVALITVHPDWGRVVQSVTISSLTMCAAVFGMMRAIRGAGDEVERRDADAEGARRALLRSRAAQAAAAEQARLLHDTVVNTLGAFADDRIASVGSGRVREQARADAARARTALMGEGATETGLEGDDLEPAVPISVRRLGLDAASVRAAAALFAVERVAALAACVRELVLNVAKHSGADHVDVRVERDGDRLVVEVVDDGVGFSPADVGERGLASSVFARAREHRIEVEVHSRPGHGTRAVLVLAPVVPPSNAASTAAPEAALIVDLQRRSAWACAAILIAASAIAEVLNRLAVTPTHALLAVVAAIGIAARLVCGSTRHMPLWLVTVAIAAIPVTCALALSSVELRTWEAVLFPSAALTVIPTLLRATARTVIPFAVSLVLTVASMLVLPAVLRGGARTDELGSAMVLTVVGLALIVAITTFLTQLEASGVRLADAERRLRRDEDERLARDAAAVTRSRWTAAGVERALDLLDEIADGRRDLSDEASRAACALEERHLRQLIVLPVGGGPLSWWLALAVTTARSRGLHVQVRVPETDDFEPALAEALGRFVVRMIEQTAPGDEVQITVVEHDGGPRLFLVGERLPGIGHDDADLAVVRRAFGAQTMIEVGPAH